MPRPRSATCTCSPPRAQCRGDTANPGYYHNCHVVDEFTPAVLDQEIDSLADLHYAVEAGLPVRALDETIRYVTADANTANALRETVVPRTTLSRRTRLKPVESEKVERLARVMALAEHVWENPDDAREF